MIVINRIRVFGRDSMSIRNWPETERPRERLIKYGASHLSNADLLAIFLVELLRLILSHLQKLKVWELPNIVN